MEERKEERKRKKKRMMDGWKKEKYMKQIKEIKWWMDGGRQEHNERMDGWKRTATKWEKKWMKEKEKMDER